MRAFLGLCGDCAFARTVDSGRSTFSMCERALTDPRFLKYPPLPVRACAGFERIAPAGPGGPEPDDKLTE